MLKTSSARSAQVSLELILMLLGLTAFFIALTPSISRAVEATQFALASQGQQAFFNDLTNAIEQTHLLGSGNAMRLEYDSVGESKIEFDESASEITLIFSFAGHEKKFSKKLLYGVQANEEIKEGKYELTVENQEGVIKVRLTQNNKKKLV